jgi:predicted nucleic acid-binding protein
VIYLDALAIVKLVRQEACTEDLVAWLNERPAIRLVTSTLTEVEVARALRRWAPQALPGLSGATGRCYQLELDPSVRAAARELTDRHLSASDAVHIATALRLGAHLEAFVTSDPERLAAAVRAGLPVVSPGRPPSTRPTAGRVRTHQQRQPEQQPEEEEEEAEP